MHVTAHATLLSLVLPFLPSLTRAALQHRPLTAQPQDPFAAPKFEVSFLNNRPISVSDAKEWQVDNGSWSGLSGSDAMDAFVYGVEDERPTAASSQPKKTIGDLEATSQQSRPNIVKLRLPAPSSRATSPLHDYLCLVPSPPMVRPTEADALAHEEALRAAEEVPDPVIGWESLRHLDGKCLYSKQGWFSYSYCHDSHVRQFREAPHQHPHPPGGLVPVEDHDFQAYNLGLSPSLVKKSTSSSSASLQSIPPVSVSRNAHARYLTQSWSSGTTCDKTGLPRKVEVQFHCKMGGVDHIGFVKEVSTCKYVLVIYTPNLCSLPGFSSSTPDDTPIHPIHCRRIIPDGEIEAYVDSFDHSSSEDGLAESMDELTSLETHSEMQEEQATERVEEDRKVLSYRFPTGYYPGYSANEPRIYEEPEWTVHGVEVKVDLEAGEDGEDGPDQWAFEREIREALQQAVPEVEKQLKDLMENLRSTRSPGGTPQDVPKLKNTLNDMLSKDPKVREEQIAKLREENIAKKKAKGEERRNQLDAKDD